MLKIRLARIGRKNQPFFRIVVIDSRTKQGGKAVEIIGWYDPLLKGEKRINIKKDRKDYWLGVGAQMSDGAKKILLSTAEKKKIWPDKKPKKEQKEGENSVVKSEVAKKDETETKKVKDSETSKTVKAESTKKEPLDKANDDKKSNVKSEEG